MRAQLAASRQQQEQAQATTLDQIQRQHNLQLQQLQQQVATIASRPETNHDTDVFTNQGAEDWFIDASIEASFSKTHLWWHMTANRWEDDWESMLRACVYAYLITKLPAEM